MIKEETVESLALKKQIADEYIAKMSILSTLSIVDTFQGSNNPEEEQILETNPRMLLIESF